MYPTGDAAARRHVVASPVVRQSLATSKYPLKVVLW
jgi:hypothetical protein